MENNGLIYGLLRWAVSAFALMVTAYFVPGFRLSGFGSALIAALVIGVVNALIRPVLFVLTFPINIITLGLFTFVLNGAMIKLCAALVPGFDVSGWGAAILGALLLAIVSTVLHYFLV